jgi:F-type H+-transporting ATPase subunit b
MEILKQLQSLLLQALPTVFLVLVFYFFLRSQFFGPLEKALAERSARTQGARHAAEIAVQTAQEKSKVYEEAMKKARLEIYAAQGTARRAVLEERNNLLRQARVKANQTVHAEKEKLSAELAVARTRLEGESRALAAAIVSRILESPSPRASGGRP